MLPSHEEERYLNKITAKSSKNEHTSPPPGEPPAAEQPFPEQRGARGATGGHPAWHGPVGARGSVAVPGFGVPWPCRPLAPTPPPGRVNLFFYVKKRENMIKIQMSPKSVIITVVAVL